MPKDQTMRIAVCDDDPRDRAAIRAMVREYLDRHEYRMETDEYDSGEAFLAGDLGRYDLVILDIFMEGLNGIETARRLAQEQPELKIIFCSTSNAYAAESYDVSALRYLTKPIQREKLFSTLDRFLLVRRALRTLTFKRSRMDEQVYLSGILWVETRDHKCIIHTAAEDIETRTTFAQLWEQLGDADFVKPIRYALVPLHAVATIPTDVLTLRDGTTIPISRDQRGEMKAAFTNYKMKRMMSRGGIW